MAIDKEEKEFLHFYMEQTWEEMRHLENLRERVTILIITLATAIAGFVIQQKFSTDSKPLIWFIIFLGFFGLFMSLKIFQIHQGGQKRLNKWYKYLEDYCGTNPQILSLRDIADLENKQDFYILSRIPHNFFWTGLYMFIIAGGLSLLFVKPVKEIESKSPANTINITLKTDSNSEVISIKKDTTIIIKTIKK
jgi:hypothetical protein